MGSYLCIVDSYAGWPFGMQNAETRTVCLGRPRHLAEMGGKQ
jgi:hypothetical protein